MEARHTDEGLPKRDTAPAIVRNAADRVLELYNRHGDARIVFHTYQLTCELAERVLEIAHGEAAEDQDTEIAQISAWFLYVGYTVNYKQAARISVGEAERFLLQEGYPEEGRRHVMQCLHRIAEKQAPATPAARILSDAHQLTAHLLNFKERSPLLHLEWEFMENRRLAATAWAKLQMQYLLQMQLHTHYARTNYEPLLVSLLREQKELVESLANKEKNNPEKPRRFHKLEKKRYPTRATQTFFRTNYRNHINLSSIADNKANIMISVNSILISVLITILTYQNIYETQPVILLPVVVFLVTGLASLIFAVLSARPKVTKINRENDNTADIKKNIVFFGNFVHLDLEDYEEAMDTVFRDDELIYGNMTRDLYHLGKVLDKKYRYLSISYNIFMVGFIATVGSFLLLLLT